MPSIGSRRRPRPAEGGAVVRELRPAPTGADAHHRRAGRFFRRVTGAAWEHRIFGLAAEFGFWMLLSLPPLLLAVIGIIGFIGNELPPSDLLSIEESIIDAARNVLSADAVDELIAQPLHEILTNGRAEVVSIGFVIALWSGSSAMATFVNTVTIAYDQRDRRGAVASRLLALWLYLAIIGVFILVLPLLVLGPSRLTDAFPTEYQDVAGQLVSWLYWPVIGVGSVLLLAALYHLAVPVRRRWRSSLPGAAVALVLWVVGSYGLRYYFEAVFGHFSVYGSLSAPVAVLLFLYVTALAILFGAEVNGEIAKRHARAD